MRPRPIPVLTELVAVLATPFGDQPERTRRQPAIDDPERLDVDLRDVAGIGGVKVRRG